MATQTAPIAEESYLTPTDVWLKICSNASAETMPRSKFVRWARWIRLHWKAITLTLGLWILYGYAYVVWLSR